MPTASAHISRNRSRYGRAALAVGAGAVLAKPVGKALGNRSVKANDPHYDMNYRSGRSQFHKRRLGFVEARPHIAIPAAAGAIGSGILLKRGVGGYGEGRYSTRQSATQKGYEDEYRRYYGRRRREDMDEDEDLREIAPILRAVGGGVGRAVRAISSKRPPTAGAPVAAAAGKKGPGIGLKAKIGLGAVGLAGAYGAYKGTKEVYRKVTEAGDPFTEDDLIEISPISFHDTARKLGPVAKWSTRGLAAADLGMLSHNISKDNRAKRTPLHKKGMREAIPVRRAGRAISSSVPAIDRALLTSAIGGSFYYKGKDYREKKLLKKVTHGQIDRSKEG